MCVRVCVRVWVCMLVQVHIQAQVLVGEELDGEQPCERASWGPGQVAQRPPSPAPSPQQKAWVPGERPAAARDLQVPWLLEQPHHPWSTAPPPVPVQPPVVPTRTQCVRGSADWTFPETATLPGRSLVERGAVETASHVPLVALRGFLAANAVLWSLRVPGRE